MGTCKSCAQEKELVYRKMCDECAKLYRHLRYRGWKERKALREGKPMPRYFGQKVDKKITEESF